MSAVRNLAAAALVLGAAAPFAGDPHAAARPALDVDSLAAAILKGEDHVSALQLARWIRDRKPGLRVVDVRSPADFAAFSIPSAENIPLDRLTRATFGPQETVVLYSEEGAHAGQAWVFLKARGVAHAYFIAGGLADWRDEVLSPVLPADASDEAKAAFQPVADLSLYFGGEPVVGAPGARATQMVAANAGAELAARRRRGC